MISELSIKENSTVILFKGMCGLEKANGRFKQP
jgi:hypothetical protein